MLIGLALFLLYEARGGSPGPDSNRIEVKTELVESLATRHALLWQRDPTSEELRALVDAHVRDEIFYREGVAAGLQNDDEIIRRRVRQKLEVLAEESGDDADGDEAALQAFLEANAARYATAPRSTFEQVFFDPERRTAAPAERAARETLRRLQTGDAAPPGDSSLLSRRAQKRSPEQIEAEFGTAFARALEQLPTGSWHGPLVSPYGLHLVRVTSRDPARVPPLAAVRTGVEREWEAERRRRALEVYYRSVRKTYQISYDRGVAPEIRSAQ
ncbi:MAG: peptidyl-prolyl cis-trans isomerase [Sandaracinobacteroides sp.]